MSDIHRSTLAITRVGFVVRVLTSTPRHEFLHLIRHLSCILNTLTLTLTCGTAAVVGAKLIQVRELYPYPGKVPREFGITIGIFVYISYPYLYPLCLVPYYAAQPYRGGYIQTKYTEYECDTDTVLPYACGESMNFAWARYTAQLVCHITDVPDLLSGSMGHSNFIIKSAWLPPSSSLRLCLWNAEQMRIRYLGS